MTVAFWCVLVVAAMPYVLVLIAKLSPEYLRGGHNRDPRSYTATLDGVRKRAFQAHLNGFEALPPFAAAVIIAHLAGAAQGTADALAVVFVLCRVLHAGLYMADLDKLRTAVWMVGIGCVVGLFVAGAARGSSGRWRRAVMPLGQDPSVHSPKFVQ